MRTDGGLFAREVEGLPAKPQVEAMANLRVSRKDARVSPHSTNAKTGTHSRAEVVILLDEAQPDPEK